MLNDAASFCVGTVQAALVGAMLAGGWSLLRDTDASPGRHTRKALGGAIMLCGAQWWFSPGTYGARDN
jgi:hypothetical protein